MCAVSRPRYRPYPFLRSNIPHVFLHSTLTQRTTDFESGFEGLESKLADTDPSYDDVLPQIEKMQEPLGYVWGVAGHLNGVKNGDELRAAYEENQPAVVKVSSKVSQSKAVYDALKKIEEHGKAGVSASDDEFMNQQMQRAVELNIKSMTLGGVGLEGAEKERFNVIKMRLAELSTKFSNNVLDATKAFGYTVTDVEDVAGVPASNKAQWAAAHVAHLKSEDAEADVPEADAEKGPWRITLDGPSYIACMSHIPNRDVREKIYKAFITRASELTADGKQDNIPNIYEILKLKQEMASLLGYKNYAELSLARKMAPSVDSVRELSDLILEKALPAAEKELAEVTALAKKDGGDLYANVEKLAPWDVTFWAERLKETKFELKEEELRPYFALPNVLDGMFGLIKRIFNVEIKPADGEAEVWNDDVQFFNVYDNASGDHIASFYLDPYSRPENKRGGAWMDVCIGKSDACNRDVPVAYLTCNGSPPVGDKPSLMTFREVVTLFHETG